MRALRPAAYAWAASRYLVMRGKQSGEEASVQPSLPQGLHSELDCEREHALPLCGRDVFNPAPQQEPLRSEPGAQNEQQEVPEAPTLAAEPDAIAGQKEVDANATQAPVSIVSKNSVRDISTHPILFEMPVFL